MILYLHLVDKIQGILSKSYNVSKRMCNGEYGYHIKDTVGNKLMWFGLDYDLWENTEIPFCIRIYKKDKEIIRELGDTIFGTPVIPKGDEMFFYLISDEYLKKEEVIKKLSGDIERLLNCISR